MNGQDGSGGLTPEVLRALEGVVGTAGLVREPGRLLAYESDALPRFRQTPAAVVLPRDTAEAAAAVEILGEAGVPLTPRGAGTGLAGGAVAAPGGVLIGTSRMTRILSLDPRRRIARVQGGVVNSDLSRAAAEFGLYYAPDPSSQAACTLGGNVGENAGGPHCLKYGVTTRYVTGLTVVGSGGQVLELGGADRAEGLDLTGVFVGSEGCFGLATELELRLMPRPRGVRTLLAVFPDTETAGAAVSAVIARGLLPAALEMMDRGTIEAVEASVFAAGYPRDAGAVLVVEFDGTEAGLDTDAESAEAICLESGATLVRRARDEAERAALWQGRKKAYGAFGRITPDLMVQDATVPRSTLPGVLKQIEEIGARHDLRLANVFHAGDGNLHPKILFDRRDEELVERVEKASKEIMQACVDAGGTITGEHGVGLDKRGYMALVHGPRELAAMAAVQRAFDPKGRWNPGKVLPPEAAGAEVAGGEVGARRGGSGAENSEAGAKNGEVGAGNGEVAEAGAPSARAGSPVSSRPHTRGRAAIQHSPEDLTVRVDGQVRVGELTQLLHGAGQWLPIDIPDQSDWTVAELVGAGEWGPLAPAFGRLRDLVLGAEVKTSGRGRLRLGGQVMKNVAGFDLVRAVSGSRGRLGTILEVFFRLLPVPQAHRVLTWQPAEGETLQLDEIADRLATHPVLPASLVRGHGRDGVDRLHLRLLGSTASVHAESAELIDVAGGGVVWEGAGGRSDFLGEDPIGRCFGSVGSDRALVEIRGGSASTAEVEAGLDGIGLRGVWRYHLPAWHVWRVAVDREALTAASDGLVQLVGELRARGGDGALLRGLENAEAGASEAQSAGEPALGRWASPEVRQLERAVAAAVTGEAL